MDFGTGILPAVKPVLKHFPAARGVAALAARFYTSGNAFQGAKWPLTSMFM